MQSSSELSTFPVSIQKLVVITVSLPLSGFIFCILFSFMFNFESSTRTHCEVPNFAPSISAAIGSFVPQKYVWQACIALHSAPRFFFTYLYREFFQSRVRPTSRNRLLVSLNWALSMVENSALLGLSLVSSQEKFEVHKACFALFLFTSFCYMCLTCFLSASCGVAPTDRFELRSLRYKKTILTVYLICVPLLLLAYYRHNEYCEPYVYSWFCVLEYVLVLANMSYHMTAYYDLRGMSVIMPSRRPRYAVSAP